MAIKLTPAHRTADHYLDTWVKTMQERQNINTLYGRIFRTNINYIVRGVTSSGQWKEIPCANLSTARLYLGMIASESQYDKMLTLFKKI